MTESTNGGSDPNGTSLSPLHDRGREVARRFGHWFTQAFAPWYVWRLERLVGPLDGSSADVRQMTLETADDVFTAAESVVLELPWRPGRAHRWSRDHLVFLPLVRRQAGRLMNRAWRAWLFMAVPVIGAAVLLHAASPLPPQAVEAVNSLAVWSGFGLVAAAFAFVLPSRLVRDAASIAQVEEMREVIARAGWSQAKIRIALDLQEHHAARVRRRADESRWGVAALWALGVILLGKWSDRIQALRETVLKAPVGQAQPGAAQSAALAASFGQDLLVLAVLLIVAAIAYAFIESYRDDGDRVLAVARAALAAADREYGASRPT